MSMQSIKDFFSTPERPVTNSELLAFGKADKDGLNELSRLTEEVVAKKAE